MTELWDTIEGDYREAFQRWKKAFEDITMTEFTRTFINEDGEIDTQILDFKDVYVDPDFKKDGYDWEVDLKGLKSFVPQIAKQLTQEHWEQSIKIMMEQGNWVHDRDDETTLGFSAYEGEYHWIRDYDKKTRGFIQYNGNQKINLVSTRNEAL